MRTATSIYWRLVIVTGKLAVRAADPASYPTRSALTRILKVGLVLFVQAVGG